MNDHRTTAAHVQTQFKLFARTLYTRGVDVEGLTLTLRRPNYRVERMNADSSMSHPFGSQIHTADEMWQILRFASDALSMTPQLRSQGSSGVSTFTVSATSDPMPANAAWTDEELGRTARDAKSAKTARARAETLSEYLDTL